jgi:DNA-binding NarL/FixJ family response regulator
MTIRVLIADDQELVRAGFRKLLDAEDTITVVGEAADGAQAVARATELAPDVVLMDIRMPRLDGIEATRRLTRSTSVQVLVLTTYDLDEYVFEALRAGASGFLLKDSPPDTLIVGIATVARGDALLAPSVTRRLITEFARRPTPERAARTTRPDPPGEGGSHSGRPRPVQPRNRQPALPRRSHHQDLRRQHLDEAGLPRPGTGRRRRLRSRSRPTPPPRLTAQPI